MKAFGRTFDFEVPTRDAHGVEHREAFLDAIDRRIEIALPTANGIVRAVAYVTGVTKRGTARIRGEVDQMGEAQLGDLFGPDWTHEGWQAAAFGPAVHEVVTR